MPFTSEIRLAKTVIGTLVKQSSHYPERLWLSAMTMFVRYGLILFIYANVYHLAGGSINGTTYQTAAWSMFLYFSVMLLALRGITKLITQDVLSGNIEVLMARPINYVFYKLYQQVGDTLYSAVIVSVATGLVLYLTIGIPAAMNSWAFVGSAIVTGLLGAILGFLIYSTIGLLAFYVEDATPIYWIVDKTVMILGGSYLPVAFFPQIMKDIAIFSPFGAANFISHTVYNSWSADRLWMIALQLGWIVILGAALALLYHNARRKLSINGG